MKRKEFLDLDLMILVALPKRLQDSSKQ
jgi:hypothetical protein